MKTRHLIVLSILAGCGTTPGVFAQALTPPPTDPATTPTKPNASSQSAAPDAPRPQRAVSSEVAASISAGMPKYNPPAKTPEPKSEEELPDLRETDKPKNQIIRLPKYIVREPRNPVLRERDVNTKAGLAAIAEHRYITDADRALNRWNIFGAQGTAGNSTTNRALLMYAEDERLSNMADLNDAAGLASATDKTAGAYIKREAQRTYMRTDDFGWSGGAARGEDRGMNDAARYNPK